MLILRNPVGLVTLDGKPGGEAIVYFNSRAKEPGNTRDWPERIA
jgi:hypothetical protein